MALWRTVFQTDYATLQEKGRRYRAIFNGPDGLETTIVFETVTLGRSDQTVEFRAGYRQKRVVGDIENHNEGFPKALIDHFGIEVDH